MSSTVQNAARVFTKQNQTVLHEQNMQREELLVCHPERWAQLVKAIID